MKTAAEQLFKDYLAGRKGKKLLSHGILIRANAVIRKLEKLNCSKTDTILDIGTADGMVFSKIIEHYGFTRPIGLDRVGSFIEDARGLVPWVVLGDGMNLPFPPNSIDIIISTAVFKHLAEIDKVLQECARVLKPGGNIIVVDPTPFGIRCGLIAGHFSRKSIAWILNTREFGKILNRNGFSVISQERFMLSPVPFFGSGVLESFAKILGLDFLFLNQMICARASTKKHSRQVSPV